MTTSTTEPATALPEEETRCRNKRERTYKRAGLFAHLMLIVAVFGVFGSMLQSPILWSEHDIVERSTYQSIERWQDAWTLDAIRSENPLSVSSYFLERLIPLDPAFSHRLINLCLHLSAALLLLHVLQALKLPGAYTTSLVFALHPALTQTLFMWGYRHELIGLIFILLALRFGIRIRHGLDYTLALALTVIAGVLHPSAAAIPIILGLIVYLKSHDIHAHDFNAVLPLLCISILTAAWVHNAPDPSASSEHFSNSSEWSTHAGQNLFFYLGRSLGSATPALFYPYDFSNLQSHSIEANLLPFCVLLPFYALALFQFRKRWSRGLLLGLTSFLALLLPALFSFGYNFDGIQAHEEHHFYVALPALLALIVTGSRSLVLKLEFAAKGLWYVAISLVLTLEVLISGSWSYALGQPAEMWRLQAEQWPDSWRSKVALLEYTLSDDVADTELQPAIKMLESIIELNPKLYDERLLLARYYVKVGQKNNALREYRILVRDEHKEAFVIEEAAQLMESLALSREARNTRKRRSGDTPVNNSTRPNSN